MKKTLSSEYEVVVPDLRYQTFHSQAQSHLDTFVRGSFEHNVNHREHRGSVEIAALEDDDLLSSQQQQHHHYHVAQQDYVGYDGNHEEESLPNQNGAALNGQVNQWQEYLAIKVLMEMDVQKEHSWCSWCFSYGPQVLVKKNRLGRDEYRCEKCQSCTSLCLSGCKAMTAGSNKLCAACKGEIMSWEQAEWDFIMMLRESTAVGHGKEFRPPWQPDEAMSACSRCQTTFTFLNRRTHCRHCGKLFCRQCCKTLIPIPNLSYLAPVPVCTFCAPQVRLTGGEPWKSITLGYQNGLGKFYAPDPEQPKGDEPEPDLINKFESESEPENPLDIEDSEPRL